MAGNVTYSFLNVAAVISGPGGTIQLGAGAGSSKEGISISFVEDTDAMTIGADGSGMHSLRASKAAVITATFLKTSPTNSKLTTMFNFQRSSSANAGQNVLTISDPVRGDMYTCAQVAFVKHPDNRWSEDGNMLEWRFNAVTVEPLLGAGA
jgi:hypothetical protein